MLASMVVNEGPTSTLVTERTLDSAMEKKRVKCGERLALIATARSRRHPRRRAMDFGALAC